MSKEIIEKIRNNNDLNLALDYALNKLRKAVKKEMMTYIF